MDVVGVNFENAPPAAETPALVFLGGAFAQVDDSAWDEDPAKVVVDYAFPCAAFPAGTLAWDEDFPQYKTIPALLDGLKLLAPYQSSNNEWKLTLDRWGKPKTYLFRTIGGRVGLLQTLSLTADEKSMNIRWKLVQDAASAATPQASATPNASAAYSGRVVVNVKDDGSLIFDRKPITAGDLKTKLAQLAAASSDQAVILRADKDVDYKYIAQVLDICASAKIWNVAFAAVQGADESPPKPGAPSATPAASDGASLLRQLNQEYKFGPSIERVIESGKQDGGWSLDTGEFVPHPKAAPQPGVTVQDSSGKWVPYTESTKSLMTSDQPWLTRTGVAVVAGDTSGDHIGFIGGGMNAWDESAWDKTPTEMVLDFVAFSSSRQGLTATREEILAKFKSPSAMLDGFGLLIPLPNRTRIIDATPIIHSSGGDVIIFAGKNHTLDDVRQALADTAFASVVAQEEKTPGQEGLIIIRSGSGTADKVKTLLENKLGLVKDDFQAPRPPTPLTPTYIFRTPGGRIGIMQTLGLSENPKGMKIRWKLVQEAAPAATPQASATPNASAASPAPADSRRVYTSSASIEIKAQPSSIGLSPHFASDQIDIIQSKPILNSVVAQLGLIHKWSAGLPARISGDEACQKLLKMITVSVKQNTDIYVISVTSADRQEAADIANAIAVAYVKKRSDDQQREITSALADLKAQLEAQRHTVDQAAAAVAKIRARDSVNDPHPDTTGAPVRPADPDYEAAKVSYINNKTLLDRAAQGYETKKMDLQISLTPAKIWEKAEPAR